MMAKTFPDQPFQSISVDSPARLLLRDRQTQARWLPCRDHREDGKEGIGRPLGAGEHTLVFRRLQEARISREAVVRNLSLILRVGFARSRLWDQANTALCATSVQHLATSARGHTGAKTVSTNTLDAAGLKSTFHDRFSEQLM